MQGVLRAFLLNGRKVRNDVVGHLGVLSPMTRPVTFSRCESTAPTFQRNQGGSSLKNDGRLVRKADDTISYAEAKKLLRLVDVESVKVKLGMEGKEVIGYSDLLKVCESTGVARSTDEAASFARVLDEAGVVLLFRDKVYLYPDKVADLVRRSVPLALTPEDDPHREELEKLQGKKKQIDALAHKQVHRVLWSGLGIAVMQVGLFFRLTFWDLSWDIMEPITFFSGSASILLGYAYFLFTSTDPSYQDLRKRLFLSRQQTLFKKHNFDVNKFKELQERSKLPIDCMYSSKKRFKEDTIFEDS